MIGSLQQQQQRGGGDVAVVPQSWGGGSNRIAAINVEGTNPQSFPSNNSKRFDDLHHDDDQVLINFLLEVHVIGLLN